MGRHRGAGQDHIAKTAAQRRAGGPFLDRVAQSNRLAAGQKGAQAEEQYRHHQPHMQARDRQQMRQTGIAHRRHHVGRNGASVAGNQGRRHGARRTRRRRPDTRGDTLPRGCYPDPYSARNRDRRRVIDANLAERVADRADALEPGVTPEIIRARRRRSRRRHEPGENGDSGTNRRQIPFSQSNPRARRCLRRAQPGQRQPVQQYSRFLGESFDADHPSRDGGGAVGLGQNGRGGGVRAVLRRREAQRHGGGYQRRDDQCARARPKQNNQYGAKQNDRRHPARRLGREREVTSDAGPEKNRGPQSPSLALGGE